MPELKNEPGAQSLAEGVKQRAQAKEDSVREYYERSERAKPTPTQEENDLAKVGALDPDTKEDDGSGPEEETVIRTMQARIPSQNPYNTRDIDQRATREQIAANQARSQQQAEAQDEEGERVQQEGRRPGRPPRQRSE